MRILRSLRRRLRSILNPEMANVELSEELQFLSRDSSKKISPPECHLPRQSVRRKWSWAAWLESQSNATTPES